MSAPLPSPRGAVCRSALLSRLFPRASLLSAAAGLGLAFAASTPARAQAPAAVINEINYAPSGADNPAEFVELHNPGDTPLDLSGHKFDSGIDYVFPAGTTLPAHGYLVISADPAAFAARWGFTPLGPWSGKLSNDGERLRLRDAADATIDSVTYGAGFPWPTAARGDGSSMELIHPALDNDLGGSWRSSGQPVGVIEPQTYLPANDVAWRYRKGTTEASAPVGAWRALGFVEDGTWQTGQTSIGFGDNDDHTLLTDMQGAYTSLFLRRVLTIPAGQLPAALTLRARVDDGCIIWINGHEVARLHMDAGLSPTYDSLAQNHEADLVAFEEITLDAASAHLVEGDNIVAVQAFNSTLSSSDFTIDVSLVESLGPSAATAPTPGAVNSCHALNAPPAVRQVAHTPRSPASADTVTVTAKVTDPDGVGSVACLYQLVRPGAYVRGTDAAYSDPANWTGLAMRDDGLEGDALAADGVYTAVLPAETRLHRHLVRYRIQAADTGGRSITVPYADDGSPNFACFVYDGVPAWTGAFNPGVTPPVAYSPELQTSLPVYHLIAAQTDVANSQYNSAYNGQRFTGTLVYDGEVYDHIRFNNRGEASTYVSGKNKWRFHFNRARDLAARDNHGRLYPETWDELNLNACASPWAAVHRGMSGVEEAVSLRLYELLGMASPKSSYLHFRVIDDASETGSTQFQGGDPAGVTGDLWGLYLAIEHPDGSFLDQRELPDGNIYKIESSLGDMKHHGDGQPDDGSDWDAFLAAAKTTQTEAWWRANLDLDAYYNFHAGNRILGNIDLRYGFNHCFHHAPDGRWVVIPWDLDMMFIPKTHWSGIIDQHNALNLAPLRIEFQNRARELLDLVCEDASPSGGQIGQLIDEYARFVKPDGASPSWADLDAAMWNQNPRTPANPSNAQTNHRGNFFTTPYFDSRIGGNWTRTLATPDFAGSMKYLVDYATDTFPAGSTWSVNNGDQRGYGYRYLLQESADASAPARPAATYLGAAGHPLDDLRFSSSAYSGAGPFAAVQWRVGEISAPGIPLHDPALPRIYEVTDVWRSEELAANTPVALPANALLAGHTYRVRVRHKDATGRWSRWSPALQFVASPARAAVTREQLVVTEIMYNPPALSSAESQAGYTDKQLFEYIELMNISDAPLDLSGVAFTTGITFAFADGTQLAAGERLVLAKNTAALALRYGADGALSGRVAGEYSGSLDNGGEQLVLSSLGQPVHDFAYDDAAPWPTSPDGNGASLVLINPRLAPDHALAASWRASAGAPAPGATDPIVYSEWAARHPDLGAPDADDDGDGRPNLLEYALGSAPDSGDAGAPQSLSTEELEVGGAPAEPYLVLALTRSTEAGDLVVVPEFSADLVAWTSGGVLLDATPNPDGTATERWRAAEPVSATPRLFARVRASLP